MIRKSRAKIAAWYAPGLLCVVLFSGVCSRITFYTRPKLMLPAPRLFHLRWASCVGVGKKTKTWRGRSFSHHDPISEPAMMLAAYKGRPGAAHGTRATRARVKWSMSYALHLWCHLSFDQLTWLKGGPGKRNHGLTQRAQCA